MVCTKRDSLRLDYILKDAQDVRHENVKDLAALPDGRDLRLERPCKVKRFLAKAEDGSEQKLDIAPAKGGKRRRREAQE